MKITEIMFTANIIFSDEATPNLSTHGNRHNVIIWCSNNTPAVIKRATYNPNFNVFCAQTLTRSVPKFPRLPKVLWEKQCTETPWINYSCRFLREKRHSERRAPSHFQPAVRDFFVLNFPGKWICPITWPPRSPDLIPLILSSWWPQKFCLLSTTA